MLYEGRLDHNITEVFLDAEVPFEHPFNDFLVVGDTPGYEPQQIVVPPAYQVAFENLVNLPNFRFEA